MFGYQDQTIDASRLPAGWQFYITVWEKRGDQDDSKFHRLGDFPSMHAACAYVRQEQDILSRAEDDLQIHIIRQYVPTYQPSGNRMTLPAETAFQNKFHSCYPN